jgi:hypothetical protein
MRNQGGNAGRQGLMTTQTRRIDELATSKAIPQGFLEDRRSVYWDRNIPKFTPEITKFGEISVIVSIWLCVHVSVLFISHVHSCE